MYLTGSLLGMVWNKETLYRQFFLTLTIRAKYRKSQPTDSKFEMGHTHIHTHTHTQTSAENP